MRPQSIVMLVDGPESGPDGQRGIASSAGATSLRGLIQRTLDPQQWRLLHCETVESAQEHFQASSVGGLIPELVVLNVDVQRGWPFCITLKKNFATVPVIVVSEHYDHKAFNNHQKLDTRADAYHRLPEELDGLEISLGYFASHKSETGEEDEGSSPRLKPRKSGRVSVPSGHLQKLETTVTEQARSLEDARRQIEALEAERDAVADKNRRQVIELMALHPGAAESGAEVTALRDRVVALEAQSLNATILEDEVRQLQSALASARAEVTRLSERPDAEALVTRLQGEVQALKGSEVDLRKEIDQRAVEVASLRTERDQLAQKVQDKVRASSPGMARPVAAALEEVREESRREIVELSDQLTNNSVQLSALATELKNSHERRLQAEASLRAAEMRAAELEQQLAQRGAADDQPERLQVALERAEAAERSWSAANARAEQLQAFVQNAAGDLERVKQEKKAIDDALAMSRRLMREYATDAARKAEELKEEQARAKALAERVEVAEKRAAELEFGSSLVESLEREVAELRARPAVVDTGEREVLQTNLEQLAAGYRAQQAEIERLQAERAEASASLAETQAAKQALDEELARAREAMAKLDEDAQMALLARLEADDAQAALAAAREQIAAVATETEHRALELVTLREEHAALSKRQAELVEEREALSKRQAALVDDVAQERAARQFVYDTMAAHAELVAQRFDALRAYAQKCEAGLIRAEAARTELESRLEALLSEVQSHALRGEVPPVMEIPLAPVFIDSDDEDEDEDDDIIEAYPASTPAIEPAPEGESVPASETLEPVATSEAPEPVAASETPEPVAASETPEPVAASETPEPVAASETPEPIAASEASSEQASA